MLKTIALVLLVGGFVGIMGALMLLKSADYSSFSQAYESLPRKDTFARQEVLEHMVDAFQRRNHSEMWIMAPATMMLAGGLLLLRTGKSARSNETPSI